MTTLNLNPTDSSLDDSLTVEQVNQYQEQGFLGPFTLCSRKEMETIYQEIDQIMKTEGPAPAPPPIAQRGRLAELVSRQRRSPVPYIESRHLDTRLVYDLCTHPAILKRATLLYGPDLILWRSTLIDKFPGAPAFRWHQDYGCVYSRGNEYGLEPPVHFTAYLALTDATVENGCLEFIPGVRAVLPTVPASEAPNATQLVDPKYVDLSKVVYMELAAGQFVLFTDRALHASSPNHSDKRRLALTVRLTLPVVKVRPHFPNHKVVLVSGKNHLGINAMAEIPPV